MFAKNLASLDFANFFANFWNYTLRKPNSILAKKNSQLKSTYYCGKYHFIILHTAEMDLSKTVPIESNARIVIFLKPYNELSILVKISKTTLINKWSKLRPKCRAYFIKAAHRRNHSRVKLATRKMFAMMHLRKKKFSNFPDSGSGIRIRTI